MGYTPREIDDLSLWQFAAAWDGFCAFHGAKPKAAAMSDDEFDDMIMRLG